MTTGLTRNVRVEGLGITSDFLLTLADRAKARPLLDPESYGLAPKEPVEEAISRSWDRLRKAYNRWTEAKVKPGADAGRYWIGPLLQELEHTDLQTRPDIVIDGKTYPLSFLGTVPIQVSPGEELDRIGQRGQLRASPHGLVQEFLNRTPAYLWGIVTNGEKLRLLRDNVQVTRPAYVQFDLEEIFDQGDSAAFRLLWLLAHRSRFEGAQEAVIEQWNKQADEQGTRANDALRDGVAQAIEVLGAGFVKRNKALRDQLSGGQLSAIDLYRLALKVVYQLVFTFVIEDRDLLHGPDADDTARERYTHYSTRRLRAVAAEMEGSAQHGDAWEGLKVLLCGMYAGLPFVGVPAFGGHLFEAHALLSQDVTLANSDLYRAIRALSLIQQGGATKTVNYAGLDAEELGSIYESLLELHPEIDTRTGTFRLTTAAGNERKTTGSYYTPSGLIELLLESALDPVIEQALAKPDPVAALKALKVIDPACGSGHFILAAARRIGLALARVTQDVTHPSPAQLRDATRTVIAHCIYGVDINPMAIELARVALWLESAVPGKPLAFLDHRLRVGNSLLGTTPDMMRVTEVLKDTRKTRTQDKTTEVRVLGLPDEAFTAIEGDDKPTVTELKKRNKAERQQQALLATGQQLLFNPVDDLAPLTRMVRALDSIEPDDFQSAQAQEAAFYAIQQNDHLRHRKLLADAWCAAFVAPKTPNTPAITTLILNALDSHPDTEGLKAVRDLVTDSARQYSFLHPHIAFPDVFDQGGFDCVLGNPPWERIKLQEKEWFAQRVPEIAAAANAAARTRKIAALKTEQPVIHAAFLNALRQAEGESHFIRTSMRYPLTGRGDVNTYAIFSELGRRVLHSDGHMGIIVPSGIATDDTYKSFFQQITDSGQLKEIHFFNNKAYFKQVGLNQKLFVTLALSGRGEPTIPLVMSCDVSTAEEARSAERRFSLTPEDLVLLNPNTRTAPIFRSARDAEITKGIYRRVPVLINEASGENPWGVKFMAMFHMSNDSGLFRTATELTQDGWALLGNRFERGGEQMLPLYEAKLMHQFDHRYATYTPDGETRDLTSGEKASSDCVPLPRYWVKGGEVEDRLRSRRSISADPWLIGFRNITNVTNERTIIMTPLPNSAVGHSMPLIFPDNPLSAVFTSIFACFALDYVARQKVAGTNMTFGYVQQFPVLPPSTFTPQLLAFITPRILELTYTANDLASFATALGYTGQPFVWDDERRFWLRAELDALFFHLYEIGRDDVDYIMETFPIVKRKDEAKYGSYRTKEAILSVYDEIVRVGVAAYQCRLPIPPADPRVAHGYTDDVSPTVILIADAEALPAFRDAIPQAIMTEGHDWLRDPIQQERVLRVAGFHPVRTVEDALQRIRDLDPRR
ncbi:MULTISPECIES: Eco57I restriction-modification methylase domain-containing protein [Deinococcus]|uniref:site-specific DNA-methyltransferase (adenine-specific) n=1 Tax=Deinococcus rufus TaxID=2136097 RepID=A0ABV7ZAA2_9DEIO|nr:N-6 DNA methylase [Deinococcus sp. AB2017081]WQE94975.1 N-6 DNA methylase [Deinococcus sp. AB2017081]